MSDYLTNLAARALGVAIAARPRPSLFEPRRGVAEAPAPEPERAGVEPSRTEPALPGRAPARRVEPPAVRPPAEPRRPPARESSPVPDGKRTPREPKVPAQALIRRHTAPPAPAEPPTSEAEPMAPVPRGERAEVRSPHDRPARQLRLAPTEPASVLTARPPRPPVPAREAEPSTVRVTIGRVDVRAVTPEQPPPKRKPKPPPRMTLDEYLRR